MSDFDDSRTDPIGLPHWPGSWPGKTVVDLDNLEDPGIWIEDRMPDAAGILFGNPDDDNALADSLAVDYISAAADLGIPLPSDFEGTPEEDEQVIKDDFLGFIREWRRRALAQKSGDASTNSRDGTPKPRRKVATWELLKGLGFVADASVMSDVMPGLSYNFGNFTLSASCFMNRWFQDVVMFTGVLVTPRSFGEVHFEMPRDVDSREQGIAWLVWNLDNQADDQNFRPSRETAWLSVGRDHRSLLPWVVDLAEYQARPHCSIRRDWCRVLLKEMREALEKATDDLDVSFHFDGEVLKVRLGNRLIAAAGSGDAWAQSYVLKARQLRTLPSRLMKPVVWLSVWKGRLQIANRCYEGVREKKDSM